MTVFLMIAALMLGLALLFILPPLLRKPTIEQTSHATVNLMVLRDQLRELDNDLAAGTIESAAHAASRQELERRVIEEAQPGASVIALAPAGYGMAWIIGLSVPMMAALLYFLLGTPAGLDPAKVSAANNQASTITSAQIESMVNRLAHRLKNAPDDVAGWNMLAHSYQVLGRYTEAANAYAHLVKLTPGEAKLFADYAEALAMSLNRTLQGEPEKLIARALALDPQNIKALALSGSAAIERHDYAAAVVQWNKIMTLIPADSELARSVADSIRQAQMQANQARPAPASRGK